MYFFFFFCRHGDRKASPTESHSTDLLGSSYMRSSYASLSHPWLTLCSLSSLTPAAPPFSPERSRCWEAIPYQQWETAFLSPLFHSCFFVLNLKLLDQAAFHLWIFGAFCAVKNLWSCIQVYGTLLGGSRVPFLIYELHCIRSVRRLVYSPIIRRFRQLWRHLWYWYWNNTIINLYLYLIFFMFKVSICEICVFASLSLLFFESQLCKCSTIKNVHRITLSSWWGQSEWESGEENGFPHMCEDSLKCGSCSCYTYGPVLEC